MAGEKKMGRPVGQNNKTKMVVIRLTEQEYVKDGSLTVGKYVASVSKEIGEEFAVAEFVLYEKGEGLVGHSKRKLTRGLRYLLHYPSEVLGMPVFMCWQYFWRRKNGFLYKGR